MDRRQFLGYSALGLAGLTILPSGATAAGVRIAPSDRIVVGFIGLGRQALNDFNGFASTLGVQVVAGCDVDSIKRERFKRRVEAWQKRQNIPQRCDMYEFYQEMLNRSDIDAVCVCTPDHWHALIAIHACQAKKDVYVQKPLAFTVAEGLDVVQVVRYNNCVLQVGSQQRSSREFQVAIELVRAGAIGHIETIYAKVGDPPVPFNLPEHPIPESLNWNQWLGPLNDPVIRYHPDLCPPVTLEPEKNETIWAAWRRYRETGNSFIADWGAHMFDIAQAAIGMDGSGPCEFIPKGYNGAQFLTMKYLNGIVMTEQPYHPEKNNQGICFNGTKGWLRVARGFIECSDPSLINKDEIPTSPEQNTANTRHIQNFIECVRSRKNPIAPVETGCSTNTLCSIACMAIELQRPVKWNPDTLCFDNDKDAANHRLYRYQYREAFTTVGIYAEQEKRAIFDGKTLNGWTPAPRIYIPPQLANTEPDKIYEEVIDWALQNNQHERVAHTGRWEIVDGAIAGVHEPLDSVHGAYLVSNEKFGDFELELEANPDWPVDTGIMIRANRMPSLGFQVLIDHRPHGNIGGIYGNSLGNFLAGGFFLNGDRLPELKVENMQADNTIGNAIIIKPDYAASFDEFKKVWRINDWNHFKIRCVGVLPLITTWINGAKICELNTANIKDVPGFNPERATQRLGRQGHIAFEIHDVPTNSPLGRNRWEIGAKCRWKNIYVTQV